MSIEQQRDQETLSRVAKSADISPQSSACSDELATVSEIAEFLQVANSWVYERSRRRGIERIPHFKLGKYLRFSKSEVREWVERQRANSLAPR